LTAEFPQEEIYGLTSQLRRSSVSVAGNIAEGYGRGLKGEYRQFLGMARGSVLELQTQLVIACKLGMGNAAKLEAADDFADEADAVGVDEEDISFRTWFLSPVP
jgi:four helix bundle protein